MSITTLRRSDPETSDAPIAKLPARPQLAVQPIDETEVGADERTTARQRVAEYRVLYVARPMAGQPHDAVEGDLNKAAREGWRLTGSITNDEGRTTGLILERETRPETG